jgi:hypothetical protein
MRSPESPRPTPRADRPPGWHQARRRTARRAGLVAVCATLALPLTGCLVFEQPPTAVQEATIGNVIVTVSVCTSQEPKAEDCPNLGNSQQSADTKGQKVEFQSLLAFRLPSGVSGPPTFQTTTVDKPYVGFETLTFTPSPSFSASLQQFYPAPPGEHWEGYISSVFPYEPAHGPYGFTASAAFTLARGANGAPFAGPFHYIATTGVRGVNNSESLPSRPVDCEPAARAHEATRCIDDPTVNEATEEITVPESSLPTRDFGVVGGGQATTSAGGTASLPFIGQLSGPSAPGLTFALGASTTLPGAAVTLSATSLTPADNSSNPIAVTVGVPSGTPAGIYPVTLTAQLLNGQTRSGTGAIAVMAPAGTTQGAGAGGPGSPATASKPKLTLRLPVKLSLGKARRHGIALMIVSATALTVRITLTQKGAHKPLVTLRAHLLAGRRTSVALRSRRLKRGRYTVTASGPGITQSAGGRLR